MLLPKKKGVGQIADLNKKDLLCLLSASIIKEKLNAKSALAKIPTKLKKII